MTKIINANDIKWGYSRQLCGNLTEELISRIKLLINYYGLRLMQDIGVDPILISDFYNFNDKGKIEYYNNIIIRIIKYTEYVVKYYNKYLNVLYKYNMFN